MAKQTPIQAISELTALQWAVEGGGGRHALQEVIFAVIRDQIPIRLCEVSCINVQAVQVISSERL